jgi:hypothetical protein
LQAALLEHDFVVQYKKETTMSADYLSRLPLLQVESHANIVQLSTLFKTIFQSFRTRIQISKPFFSSSKPLNGFCISTNDN